MIDIFLWRVQLMWTLFKMVVLHRYEKLSSCSNRHEMTSRARDCEVFLRLRNIYEPDGYSRVEIFDMLKTIRYHQRKQGWSTEQVEQAEIFAEAEWTDKRS